MKLTMMLPLLFILVLCLSVDAGLMTDEDLIASWPINENSGNLIYDVSGNDIIGELQNFAFPSTYVSGWNPGLLEPGLLFHHLNPDWIDLGENRPWQTSIAGSITAWVRYDTNPASNSTRVIFAATDSGDAASLAEFVVWNRAISPTGPHLSFAIYEASLQRVLIYGQTRIDLGRWYFFAVVQDGSGNKLYVNGAEDNTVSDGISLAASWIQDVNNIDFNAIGVTKRSGSLQRSWDGFILDVRIYDRPLTDDEISNLSSEQPNPSLALFWAATQAGAAAGQVIMIH